MFDGPLLSTLCLISVFLNLASSILIFMLYLIDSHHQFMCSMYNVHCAVHLCKGLQKHIAWIRSTWIVCKQDHIKSSNQEKSGSIGSSTVQLKIWAIRFVWIKLCARLMMIMQFDVNNVKSNVNFSTECVPLYSSLFVCPLNAELSDLMKLYAKQNGLDGFYCVSIHRGNF